MKPILPVVFVVGLAVAATHAEAQDDLQVPEQYNAETMLRLCQGEISDAPKDVQSLTCTFRIQGVADMMLYNCGSKEAGHDPAPHLSAYVTGSRGAVRQTFINYMEDHPEVWGEHWSLALAIAFSEMFPCEN